MKVLITGGNGYIAQGLYRDLKDVNITLLTRKDVDLLDSNQVDSFFKDKKFDVIIHTAIVGGSRLKEDDAQVCYDNLKMFFNLRTHFLNVGRVIMIGSGAELDRRYNITKYTKSIDSAVKIFPIDPYGMSKKIIKELATPNTTHLRVYNVFDSTELDTRFIKRNILNYINKKPIEINANRKMSFFSLKDLAKVVHMCIFSTLNYDLDCVYNESVSLVEIASMINNLGDHKCYMNINQIADDLSYEGNSERLYNTCKLDGLAEGIKEMYQILSGNSKNT